MIITLALIVVVFFAWGSLALWVQFARQTARRGLLLGLWALVTIFFIVAILVPFTSSLLTIAVIAYLLSMLALLYWWQSVRPSNDRAWIPEVSRQTQGTIHGNLVTIKNVRNFIWHQPEQFTPQWETRQYDLSRLASVDLVLSYWSSPAIAHALVSFGFGNDEYLVFSVEIRRKQADAFSELGGFFKMYELSIIAADERDVLLYAAIFARKIAIYIGSRWTLRQDTRSFLRIWTKPIIWYTHRVFTTRSRATARP